MAAVICTGAQLLKQQSGIISIACVRVNNYSTENKSFNLSQLKRGTGGRSSFNGIVATVFGATGFVGRYVCNKLGKIGTQLIIPYRGDTYEPLRLRLCGDLGQVLFTPFNLRDINSIEKAVKYSNVVINLIGRDWETRNFNFTDVHTTGARVLAKACKKAGVERFIHLSALNADGSPPSYLIKGGSGFYKSKAWGEEAVLEEFPEATIFRPADIYGQEDRFLRYYAHAWRRQIQWLPLYCKGESTIKQPVFVSDLAAGIIAAIKDPESAGKIYQAIGPNRYYLSDLCDWFYKIMKKDAAWGYWRYDMKYDPLFNLKVAITKAVSPYYPMANLHWERIERECGSDIVNADLPTLEDLGICVTKMEDQVPWELKPFSYGLYYGHAADEPYVLPNPPAPVA